MGSVPKLTPVEYQKAYDDGEREGYAKGLQEVLNWVEKKYILDDNRPDRGSPEGNALMTFAREAGQDLTKLMVKGPK